MSNTSSLHPDAPVAPREPSDPADIPVPEDTEDDLLSEAFILADPDDDDMHGSLSDNPFRPSSTEAWMCEIFITQEDVQCWRQEKQPEQMAFAVSAAKRQRSEVKLATLTPSQQEEFRVAKSKEVQSWLDTGTVQRILRNKLPLDSILRCRWILSWKLLDGTQDAHVDPKNPKTRKAKARLVILGYEDPQIDSIPRDSPTLGRDARALLLQLIASCKWDVMSFDVRTAFLRGRAQESRILGLEPPEELRQRMNLKPDECCQLLKGAYGLVDAPYLWYQELRGALERLGFKVSPFDACLFVLPSQTDVPHGALGIHVDDGIGGGDPVFQKAIQELERQFPFGSKLYKDFKFTGLRIRQKPDYSIVVDQTEYVQNIEPINVDRHRRPQRTAEVTERERHLLRGVIGSLQYAAVNTRPDLSSHLSHLQSTVNNKACVQDLLDANHLLHDAKLNAATSVKIQAIPIPNLRFLVFSDASFASESNPSSQKGELIMAASKEILDQQQSQVNPLAWSSKKIQRTVNSTLAAETMALSGALDHLSWLRLAWGWLVCQQLDWRKPETALSKLPEAVAVVDCKSLYDLLLKTATPQCHEFRTLLEALVIKERLSEGVCVRWVHSAAQLADVMTKIMDASNIRTCLSQGRYMLHDVHEVLRERADRRTRRQWIEKATTAMETLRQNI